MSVIQSIRDRGTWIIFTIIAVALIAFILQDGVGRGGSAFSNTTTIGEVNGQKLERAAFEEKLAMQEKMYASQGAQRDQLIGSLWNQEVDRLLIEAECAKLGLQVTAKELSDILFSENSPLKQEFTDPATGIFKVEDAKKAFAQIKKSKNTDQIKMINQVYIQPVLEQVLRSKYSVLLQKSAYIPKWMVEKQAADNNQIASASVVFVPYATIADSTIKVTDNDIAAYVKAHASAYKKEEETRSIAYVTFSASPSSADSAAVLNNIVAQKQDFTAATDNAGFLNRVGSDIAYYDGYFSKNRMQQTNKDTLVKIPVGTVYGPYVDGNSYVLAKMIGVKNLPDSAKVRHILITTLNPSTGQQIRPDSIAKNLIDSIKLAITGGADFGALALKYSDDGGSKNNGGVIDYFPQGKMVGTFNDFSFEKPKGSKDVVKSEYGYHYIEVLDQKNFAPAYKIAYLSKAIGASNETVAAASSAASAFIVNAKSQKEFEQNALKNKLQILNGVDIKKNDFTITGLGKSRETVRWVYDNKVGTISSEPTEIGDVYVVAMITSISEKGTMGVAEAKPLVEGLVRNELKAKQIIASKFKGSTLEDFVKSSSFPAQRVDSLSFASPFVPGVGAEPKVVGAAFNKSLIGKSTAPIEGTSGVFAVKPETISATAIMQDTQAIKSTLLQAVQSNIFRGFEAIKKSAKITDNRSTFY
jgi:peptidyl-prolyl cis-trans isomerase D